MAEIEESYYERRLLREIEAVEGRIRGLASEKTALQRLLVRARRERLLGQEVGRKNSIDRVLIESKVIEVLEKSPKPLSSRELYLATTSIIFPLNDNTFRSHLHRLKKRGAIENVGGRPGVWQLGQ